MSTSTTPSPDRSTRQRLRAHYGVRAMPFDKAARAARMFESTSQSELVSGLCMWTELRGIALVTGSSGVGKSISLRRFTLELARERYLVIGFSYLPTTAAGLLRSLGRKLGLPARQYAADSFDAVQRHLATFEERHGQHPIVVVDDAEGMSAEGLDVIRRLTCHDLDGEQAFSVVLSATDDVLKTFERPELEPLRTRVSYANALRPFGAEDTRSYVRHHLQAVDGAPDLFSEDAITHLFNASRGRPRAINQLATQALIAGAVAGHSKIDGRFMKAQIESHPLYKAGHKGAR